VPIIITNIFDQHEASRVISILATDLKARMSTEDATKAIVNPHQPGNRRFLPRLTKEFIELYNKYECALEIVRRTHLDKNHVKASRFRNIELNGSLHFAPRKTSTNCRKIPAGPESYREGSRKGRRLIQAHVIYFGVAYKKLDL
jgi:hypothetical protein